MEYAFAAMMGWCGTKWPGWWRGPPPPPDPWRLIGGVIGAAGGVGAWVIFGGQFAGQGGLIPIAAIAFFGGVFAGSVVDSVMGLSGKAGPR